MTIMKNLLLTIFILANSSCVESKEDTCIYQIKNENLYVKSVYWGINGNSRMVTVSLNKNSILPFEEQQETDIVYSGYFPIYLKLEKDTLFIYTYVLTKIPKNFHSVIKIKQIEIGNKENMMFMNDKNYIDIDKICEL